MLLVDREDVGSLCTINFLIWTNEEKIYFQRYCLLLFKLHFDSLLSISI